MTRPLVVAALLAALLVSGCATRQAVVRPAGDPDELTAAIARSGRGEGEATPVPPGPSSWHEGVTTAGKVGQFCVALPVALTYAAASHSSAKQGGTTTPVNANFLWPHD